jgi:hypothetical protein
VPVLRAEDTVLAVVFPMLSAERAELRTLAPMLGAEMPERLPGLSTSRPILSP